MKDLTVNGVIYAKYEVDNNRFGDIIFIKKLINIIPDSEVDSENFLIHLIGLIENKKFVSAGYLNV